MYSLFRQNTGKVMSGLFRVQGFGLKGGVDAI